VKHKFKGIKTGKLRLPQQKMMFEIGEQEWLLIRQAEKTIHGLEPKLLTCFNRITLIHQTKEEKITIDTDLRFRLSDQELAFNNCAILEIKTETSRPSEKVHEAIHALMLRQSPFSKYAIGVALLEKSVRANLFKPIILQLKKTEHG
ncbi:MAG: VTC domain-containing protein, partial [Chitinophagales bacterium]|nr:VTC domain-containing protein [Chitinophagales bacterium]